MENIDTRGSILKNLNFTIFIRMKHYVYKITNLVNNKIYIGKHSTSNPNDGYMGSGKILKIAIKKYGMDKFKKEILFEFDSSFDALLMESDIVDETFVARLDTYNIKIGGAGGWDHVDAKKASEKGNLTLKKKLEDEDFKKEYFEKLSASMKLYHKYNNNAFKGKRHTDDTKKKIGSATSLAQRGEGNSQFGTVWVYNLTLKKSRKVKGDDLNRYLDDGWLKGRKMNF